MQNKKTVSVPIGLYIILGAVGMLASWLFGWSFLPYIFLGSIVWGVVAKMQSHSNHLPIRGLKYCGEGLIKVHAVDPVPICIYNVQHPVTLGDIFQGELANACVFRFNQSVENHQRIDESTSLIRKNPQTFKKGKWLLLLDHCGEIGLIVAKVDESGEVSQARWVTYDPERLCGPDLEYSIVIPT